MTEFSPLSILFICTGNICRSPLAAQVLEHELTGAAAGGRVTVLSRGTHARVGEPMDPPAAKQSEALGGDSSSHLASQLVEADLAGADLVVTMTLAQRASAARMLPAASKKSVTLLELQRMIDHLASESGASPARSDSPLGGLANLLAQRSAVPPPRHEADLDIPDPFRRSSGTHVRVAREIQAAVLTLAGWLEAALPEARANVPVAEAEDLALEESPASSWPAFLEPEPVTVPVQVLEPVTVTVTVLEPEPVQVQVQVLEPEPVRMRVRERVREPEPVRDPEPTPAVESEAQPVPVASTVALTRRQLRALSESTTAPVTLTRREARALHEQELREAEHRASVHQDDGRETDEKAERVAGQHIGGEVHTEQHPAEPHRQHSEYAQRPERG
ncbi:hypothetical protein B7R54_03095 [Subtercola boreus]|uniref:protein-tyrosine-phosphatase n=1 Tax=Subtercola boreus TaxID=120213 RepID=A0A3E0VF07_9MICO|nr:hypothetical protein B7R54_03095 [Subtercola boreus]TQL54775.1 protein-tyrosine-phosphatase [Subtercola boreus]